MSTPCLLKDESNPEMSNKEKKEEESTKSKRDK